MTRRHLLSSATRLALGVALLPVPLALAGCGGSGDIDELSLVTRVVRGPETMIFNLFSGAQSPISFGRGFISFIGNDVFEVGYEIDDGAFDRTSVPAFGVPLVMAASLPLEATQATPFKTLVLRYWSGHEPEGIGTVAYLQPIFLLQSIQTPSTDLVIENRPLAKASELPGSFQNGTTLGATGHTSVIPGVGTGYENPTFPHLTKDWDSISYNYLVYNGHVNGIGAGATVSYLRRTEPLSKEIARPVVYPVAGLFPGELIGRYDPLRKVHVVALRDWKAAERTL